MIPRSGGEILLPILKEINTQAARPLLAAFRCCSALQRNRGTRQFSTPAETSVQHGFLPQPPTIARPSSRIALPGASGVKPAVTCGGNLLLSDLEGTANWQ
jgi:hypothetical protein